VMLMVPNNKQFRTVTFKLQQIGDGHGFVKKTS
jgi:hypothetical protein